MKSARNCRGILARQRHAQGVGRAARLARSEHAPERRLPLGERALKYAPPLRERRRLGAQRSAFSVEPGEGAVGLRDRALRIAQRVACFIARFLFLFQFLAQRFDAASKRLEVFVPGCCKSGSQPKSQEKEKNAAQALAFPCADTAAMRLATSPASPR